MALPLILASASPRRLDLLKTLGVVPSCVAAADVDETPAKGELPRAMALRLALLKGEVVAKTHPDALVLAADTVVAVGRRVLFKAETDEEVRRCWSLMTGRKHRVYTGVALFLPDGRRLTRLSESSVTFKRLEKAEIDAYVASKEGLGKAGGYAIQGLAAAFIRAMAGSYSGIVGLPLFETAQMLRAAGVKLGDA